MTTQSSSHGNDKKNVKIKPEKYGLVHILNDLTFWNVNIDFQPPPPPPPKKKENYFLFQF